MISPEGTEATTAGTYIQVSDYSSSEENSTGNVSGSGEAGLGEKENDSDNEMQDAPVRPMTGSFE